MHHLFILLFNWLINRLLLVNIYPSLSWMIPIPMKTIYCLKNSRKVSGVTAYFEKSLAYFQKSKVYFLKSKLYFF